MGILYSKNEFVVGISDKAVAKRDRKLQKISNKITRYQNARKPNFLILKLKQEHLNLNNELNRLITLRLERENDEFKEIAKRNCNLLRNSNLVFKTSRQGMSLTGSYVNLMKGRLHNNGHIYCHTEKTNISLLNPFADYYFPSKFEGKIDCLGNVELHKTATRSALFNRVPIKLEGEITENGTIKVSTTEREHDFISGGKHIISRIVSSYTFANPNDENEFFENRNLLVDMINEYKQRINDH